MAVSLGTMILRNGVAIAAAPIIIPPSIVIANKAKIKDAFNSFLMKKFASDDIKGDNFVDEIIESTNVIDELRKLQLGINFGIPIEYDDIQEKNKTSFNKFKNQFDSFFENKTTKLEKKDPENTEPDNTNLENTEPENSESEKKELMYLYYYRKANISIKDNDEQIKYKLRLLKDTIVKMKEQERDRFKNYLVYIVKKDTNQNNNDNDKELIETFLTSEINNLKDIKNRAELITKFQLYKKE
jgi:hypothetical protein